ncbi:uncharacterized protein [Drosophila kikkawai]|uniref:Uncharacterized protein n=1 Tax=Drosophila kikkawai TaxID=30033 RepID=A0ABM4GEJ9_DROKI
MAKLTIILFLFALCAVATSNHFYHLISRTDHSTVTFSPLIHHNMHIEIQGETEKVNEFLKKVDEGRVRLEGPYPGIDIQKKFIPWCGTVDEEDLEKTKDKNIITEEEE